MKRIFACTFVILMSALVFYGGAGVNVISFCCNDCRNAGTEVLKKDMCCEIHGHSHHEHEVAVECDDHCNIQHTDEMCCNLKRIDFDWDTQLINLITPEPSVCDLFSIGLSEVSLVPLPEMRDVQTVMPTGPPLCPRTYLSLLTVLLI